MTVMRIVYNFNQW